MSLLTNIAPTADARTVIHTRLAFKGLSRDGWSYASEPDPGFVGDYRWRSTHGHGSGRTWTEVQWYDDATREWTPVRQEFTATRDALAYIADKLAEQIGR